MKLSNLSKNKKYLLACSYGPDSMALFYLLLENNISFDVAHINYHLRKESDSEEKSLHTLCDKLNIKIYIKSVYFDKSKSKNIENWAREERYNFFESIYKINKFYEATLIAHNKDDLIETYLIQKKRNSNVNYYGLKKVIYKNDVKYIRPLLKYRKQELLNYNQKNNYEFSIDSSNLDNSYLRNNIRNNFVSKFSNSEVDKEILKIKKENKLKKEKEKIFKTIKIKNNKINYLELKTLYKNKKLNSFYYFINNNDLQKEIFTDFIYYYLNKNKYFLPFSKKEIIEIYEKINLNKITIKKLQENYYFIYQYGYLRITPIYWFRYEFLIDKNGCAFFTFFKNKSAKEFIDKNGDFFIIKPISKDEFFYYFAKNKERKKPVKKLITDMKLPIEYRYIYPGVYTKNNMKLVYVPRYQEVPVNNRKSILKFNLQKIINNFYK